VSAGDQIVNALRAVTPDNEIQLMRTEIVGAQMGDELADSALIGILVALFAVFLYVSARFQMKFSLGAILALAHDAFITVGFFSVFQLEFDLTVLAAVLAIIGFSINDSIVVADRIRENFRIMRETSPFDVVNISLTQTLGRTTITSGTVVLSVLALFFVGGELIHNFSIALLVGIIFGTYSSVFVSTALTMEMKLTKEDLLPPAKEGAELDEMP
jgi:preprotein translocase subunit SecF